MKFKTTNVPQPTSVETVTIKMSAREAVLLKAFLAGTQIGIVEKLTGFKTALANETNEVLFHLYDGLYQLEKKGLSSINRYSEENNQPVYECEDEEDLPTWSTRSI